MKPASTKDIEVVIIGAGPVGLLLANLLGKRGLRVLVAEERQEPQRDSMAIGITPSSLLILKSLELDRTFLERGIPVNTVTVFENGEQLGNVFFSSIPAEHQCMLSLPQSETIALLRENLRNYSTVQLLNGVRFVTLQEDRAGVQLQLEDTSTGEATVQTAPWLIGCDGHRSAVRQCSGIRFPGHSYRPRFCMADFNDHTDWGSEARLYFGRHGAVESFPLPDNRRRWIVQRSLASQPEASTVEDFVSEQVLHRTGIDLTATSAIFASQFQPQRHLAASFTRGRVMLCGDAAHVMSPIGGQGMNTGFADAAHLDRLLSTILNSPESADALLTEYTCCRRRAFNRAANRAARGMWLGTRRGMACSMGRRILMNRVLLRAPVRDRLASSFAMLTTPGSEMPYAT